MVEHRQFTVYFVDDKLARWEGDEMPASAAQLNRIAADRTLAPEPSADDKGYVRSASSTPQGQLVSLRVAVAGAGGRMGQALIEAVLAAPDLALAAALDVAGQRLRRSAMLASASARARAWR